MIGKQVRLILHCNCEKASLLTSESLDRPLSFGERWATRLHHLVCSHCLRAARQVRQMHRAIARLPRSVRYMMSLHSCHLSIGARKRIVEQMRRS